MTKPPIARVLVVGLRREGTSEVIAALRSIATPDRLEPSPPRVWTRPQTPVGQGAAIADPGPSASVAHAITLESAKRSYVLFECCDGPSSLGLCAAARFDAVLWVRSAEQDTELETSLPTLGLARFLGAAAVIVFVTDAERVTRLRRDRVEQEARDTIALAGFASDEAPVICSTGVIDPTSRAWREGVCLLRDALDERVPYVEADSFVAAEVRDVFEIRGRGTVVAAAVVAGDVRVNDAVELLSARGRTPTTIVGLDLFRRPSLIEAVRVSRFVGIHVPLSREQVSVGDFIVSPGAGAIVTHAVFEGFCWQNQRKDSLLEPLQCVTSAAARLRRVISSEPSLARAGACSVELRFDAPTPLLHGHPLNVRRRDDPPFATITLRRAIE